MFNSYLPLFNRLENKEKLTCEICGKSYIRPWSYYTHLREHEDEPKKHQCMTCNKIFSNVNGLKQHLSTHHLQESKTSPYSNS